MQLFLSLSRSHAAIATTTENNFSCVNFFPPLSHNNVEFTLFFAEINIQSRPYLQWMLQLLWAIVLPIKNKKNARPLLAYWQFRMLHSSPRTWLNWNNFHTMGCYCFCFISWCLCYIIFPLITRAISLFSLYSLYTFSSQQWNALIIYRYIKWTLMCVRLRCCEKNFKSFFCVIR